MHSLSDEKTKQSQNNLGIVVLVLSLLTMFAPFATDTYLAGFPAIAASLGCNSGEVQLSLSTFFFGLAIGQLFYGPISDRLGRRIPLLMGITLFIITSAAIVFAPDLFVFVILRFFQGVGGCAGMIISRAIIRDMFNTQESAKVMSLMMVLQSLGPIVAPILGGYILTVTHWHGIFYFLVLLGCVSFGLSLVYIPETLATEKRQKNSLGDELRILARFFIKRQFIVPALAGSMGLAAMFVFISGSPFVIIEIHGVLPQHYGYLFGLNAAGYIVTSFLNRYLLNHFSTSQLLGSSILFAIVMSGSALAVADTQHLSILLILLFFSLSTIPVIGANSVAIAMEAARDNAGSGSSIIGLLQFGIAALMSGLVGVLHNGTSYPMTGLIFAAFILSGIIYLVSIFSIEKQPGLKSD